MANNYVVFSEMLTDLTDEERQWLDEMTDEVRGPEKDEIPRIWAEYLQESEHTIDVDPDSLDYLGFGCKLDDDGFWMYSDESANMEHVAYFVHRFLQRFRSDQYWSAEFAFTCDKLRCGEHGGGALFVTATSIDWMSGYAWICEQEKKFKAGGKPR